jgi:hypothetical protein
MSLRHERCQLPSGHPTRPWPKSMADISRTAQSLMAIAGCKRPPKLICTMQTPSPMFRTERYLPVGAEFRHT